jgi:hypothetical protein
VSAIAERVPFEEISRQAREIRFGRTVLAAITGILCGAGWLTAKLFAVLWLVLAWSVTAVRVGWEQAQAHQKPPRSAVEHENAELLAEIERLRQENARLTGG